VRHLPWSSCCDCYAVWYAFIPGQSMCNWRTMSLTMSLQHLCKFALRLYMLIVQTRACQCCGICKPDMQEAKVVRQTSCLCPAPLALREQCARYAEPSQSTFAQSIPATYSGGQAMQILSNSPKGEAVHAMDVQETC
jgi:hypothetical protein